MFYCNNYKILATISFSKKSKENKFKQIEEIEKITNYQISDLIYDLLENYQNIKFTVVAQLDLTPMVVLICEIKPESIKNAFDLGLYIKSKKEIENWEVKNDIITFVTRKILWY